MRRPLATVAASIAVILMLPGVALAAWGASGGGGSYARAVSMPGGSAPTAVNGNSRQIVVSWPQATLPDGTPVAGYRVRRYDAGGVEQAIGASCSGVIAALTCTESALPTGTWRYTVTPRQGGWSGVKSGQSAPLAIAAPSLVVTAPPWITSLPSNLPATLAVFAVGESITWRLDDPATGPVLSAVPPVTIGLPGTGATTITIPAGTAEGVHTVYAVGSLGFTANASINVDATAPTISNAALIKSENGTSGFVRQGGTYYVYATVNDGASGVATVTADASAITTGGRALPMSAGSWTVRGITYNYRSVLQTANAVLPAGAKALTVTATDVAGNFVISGPGATVDNTSPSAIDVQATNSSGGTVGRAETGDTLTLSHSESIEPESLVAGWDGSAMNMTVRLVNQGGGDRIQLFDAADTTAFPVGVIRLGDTNYVSATVSFTGSSMTMTGSTLVLTLGTPNLPGSVGTVAVPGAMRYTPAATLYDRAGNAPGGGPANETAPVDVEF